MNAQSDVYIIMSNLFNNFIKLFFLDVPGCNFTYLELYLFFAVAYLVIRFTHKLFRDSDY